MNSSEFVSECLVTHNLLNNQHEFLKLTELAGIKANPIIFSIFIQLLNMSVEPEAIFKLLKLIIRKNRRLARHVRTTRELKSTK